MPKFKFNQCSCQEQFCRNKTKRAQLDIENILNILAQFSEWFKRNSYENSNSISLAVYKEFFKINKLFTTKHYKEYTLKIPAQSIEQLRI